MKLYGWFRLLRRPSGPREGRSRAPVGGTRGEPVLVRSGRRTRRSVEEGFARLKRL